MLRMYEGGLEELEGCLYLISIMFGYKGFNEFEHELMKLNK